MPEQTASSPLAKLPDNTGPAEVARAGTQRRGWFLPLRRGIPLWLHAVLGVLCVLACFALWWCVTRGEAYERILSPHTLPSPAETFQELPGLVKQRQLRDNTETTLKRLALGFGLAIVIGVPLGVLCGVFTWANALFLPVNLFGRNIPIAALVPLTFFLFGIGELQKIMFIFIACVAFVITDTARAISDVGEQYVDTAYTLGASRWQVVMKILVPLALPSVFNSLRLLFGLAFGYIMLAEVIKFADEAGGLGHLINNAQRRGLREDIILILLFIPLVALAIDRLLFWIQRELFPHRYGGAGMLNKAVRAVLHGWEDVKLFVRALLRRAKSAVTSGSKPQQAKA